MLNHQHRMQYSRNKVVRQAAQNGILAHVVEHASKKSVCLTVAVRIAVYVLRGIYVPAIRAIKTAVCKKEQSRPRTWRLVGVIFRRGPWPQALEYRAIWRVSFALGGILLP